MPPTLFNPPFLCPQLKCGTRLTPQQQRCPQCETPAHLNRHYLLCEALAEGGMGKTYLAQDIRFVGTINEFCVLKELKGEGLQDDFVLQLRREASRLLNLRHPSIPAYRDFFEEPMEHGSRWFLSQEYIEGTDLQSRLDDEGPVALDEALSMLREVLQILDYIHSYTEPGTGELAPLLHLDIKPANLMRRRGDGRLFLIDFGIATQLQHTIALSQGAKASVKGYTPGFAPFEQTLGQAAPASDLYSLTMTFLVMLTGKHPTQLYTALDQSTYFREYCSMPEALARLMDRMLDVKLKLRLPSAAAYLQALDSLERGGSLALQGPLPSGSYERDTVESESGSDKASLPSAEIAPLPTSDPKAPSSRPAATVPEATPPFGFESTRPPRRGLLLALLLLLSMVGGGGFWLGYRQQHRLRTPAASKANGEALPRDMRSPGQRPRAQAPRHRRLLGRKGPVRRLPRRAVAPRSFGTPRKRPPVAKRPRAATRPRRRRPRLRRRSPARRRAAPRRVQPRARTATKSERLAQLGRRLRGSQSKSQAKRIASQLRVDYGLRAIPTLRRALAQKRSYPALYAAFELGRLGPNASDAAAGIFAVLQAQHGYARQLLLALRSIRAPFHLQKKALLYVFQYKQSAVQKEVLKSLPLFGFSRRDLSSALASGFGNHGLRAQQRMLRVFCWLGPDAHGTRSLLQALLLDNAKNHWTLRAKAAGALLRVESRARAVTLVRMAILRYHRSAAAPYWRRFLRCSAKTSCYCRYP